MPRSREESLELIVKPLALGRLMLSTGVPSPSRLNVVIEGTKEIASNEANQLDFRLSKHAEKELERRKIPRAFLDEVLQQPEQIVPQYGLEKVYQSRLAFGNDRIFLVRVIVDDTVSPAIVVTVYRTSKIKKYWREP